jgi:imidazolonepropionase-like amidohydrolase
LDGVEWKAAIGRHTVTPDENFIRKTLKIYQDLGYTYLRDGGDRWGVGAKARELATEYGITYRTPLAPLCKAGHYGSFIGTIYNNMKEYAALVAEAKAKGADFIKIMISGLMDFDRFGVLTQAGLAPEEIKELIHIAHAEGMSVMAHANGAETVLAAAEAGVDSVEHGAYLNEESLHAMKENGTVWVPTLSTVGNLRGKGRFSETDVQKILECALCNVEAFHKMGGILAAGTDAGAWAVPHGSTTEEGYLAMAGVTDTAKALAVIQRKF